MGPQATISIPMVDGRFMEVTFSYGGVNVELHHEGLDEPLSASFSYEQIALQVENMHQYEKGAWESLEVRK